MGNYVFRQLCMWSKLCLLIAAILACKPLVRQRVSDLSAISDEYLTLGAVPITRSDGMHAYRMLLCKKSKSYTPSMFADDNICRTALLNREGAEVALMPNELKRDFGTKYKGYAKQATLMSLAIVPFAIAGMFAGKWRHAEKIDNLIKQGSFLGSERLSGKFTYTLVNKGLSDKSWKYYKATWDNRIPSLIKTYRQDASLGVDIIVLHANSLATAAKLKNLADNQKTIAELSKLSPDKRLPRFAKLEEEVKALNNNNLLDDADGSFLKEFKAVDEKLRKVIAAANNAEGDMRHRFANELEQASKSYSAGT